MNLPVKIKKNRLKMLGGSTCLKSFNTGLQLCMPYTNLTFSGLLLPTLIIPSVKHFLAFELYFRRMGPDFYYV